MKKIYQVCSTTANRSLCIEEKQITFDEVVIHFQCDGDEFVLPFPRDEFNELCNLRYSLQFPPAQIHNL